MHAPMKTRDSGITHEPKVHVTWVVDGKEYTGEELRALRQKNPADAEDAPEVTVSPAEVPVIFRVGDKEYTGKELEAMRRSRRPNPAPVATPTVTASAPQQTHMYRLGGKLYSEADVRRARVSAPRASNPTECVPCGDSPAPARRPNPALLPSSQAARAALPSGKEWTVTASTGLVMHAPSLSRALREAAEHLADEQVDRMTISAPGDGAKYELRLRKL